MTKRIVAFQWLRVNGRRQNEHIKREQRQQSTPDKPKSAADKFKSLCKRGGR